MVSSLPYPASVGLIVLCVVVVGKTFINSVSPSGINSTSTKSDANAASHYNARPVVGVFTKPSDSDPVNMHYIAASYIKWLESVGVRSVVIPETANNATIESIFREINGVLFPGGGETGVPDSMRRMWELAVAENDSGGVFPIWATSSGFHQVISMLSQEGPSIIRTDYDAQGMNLALNLEESEKSTLSSTLFRNPEIVRIVANEPVAMNNHVFGVHPATFRANERLNSMFRILSTNKDRKGKAFVSTIEARRYPFYGVQWHPEKNNFENLFHGNDIPDQDINHSDNAIKVTFEMGYVFARAARRNEHRYSGRYPLAWDYQVIVGNSDNRIPFEQVFLVHVQEWNHDYATHMKPKPRAIQ